MHRRSSFPPPQSSRTGALHSGFFLAGIFCQVKAEFTSRGPFLSCENLPSIIHIPSLVRSRREPREQIGTSPHTCTDLKATGVTESHSPQGNRPPNPPPPFLVPHFKRGHPPITHPQLTPPPTATCSLVVTKHKAAGSTQISFVNFRFFGSGSQPSFPSSGK